ncbi:MAG: hypothetical protein CVT49_16295 [candidate division Zixibacteria bacterium HGW-Zixibacteria-1]|nr:MAG: hypothetical protein CVT49_16295 [candidate division Zixibacteria bacterium HGW-Zixibacteria-1]
MAVPVMGYFGQEFGRPLVDIFSAVIDRSTPFSPASEILQDGDALILIGTYSDIDKVKKL